MLSEAKDYVETVINIDLYFEDNILQLELIKNQ